MPHIRNIHDVEHAPVQMDGVKGARMALMVGKEHGAPNFSLRHFNVEPHGHTPRHSHDYEHEVFIEDGGGTILLDGAERPIKRGDVVYVPANEEHQFKAADSGLSFLCLVPGARQCGDPTPGS